MPFSDLTSAEKQKVWQVGLTRQLLQDIARDCDDTAVKEIAKHKKKQAKEDYFASLSVSGLEEIREKKAADEKAAQMPGKPKRVDGSKTAVRRRANVGNLLHSHSTVEESLAGLVNRNRWD